MRHLDYDYVQDRKPTGLIIHLQDTIDALGGPIGLACIGLGIIVFYFVVLLFLTRGRKQRSVKKTK